MKNIKDIIIVGGGTSGWMSAAFLAKMTQGKYNIRLVESNNIGTIGVGEATIPAIKTFNNLLGINEKNFIEATQGTFKLGIQFCNWGGLNEEYLHGFGPVGQQWGWLSFYQYWLKLKSQNKAMSLDNFSLNNQIALANCFSPARTDMPKSPLKDVAHAYQFDAGLYGKFLRDFSEKLGVIRTEGTITQVKQYPDSGFIQSLLLKSGEEIMGDLFIDCSGMSGLLIEQTLKTGFEDWSHWLPCDSAIAVASKRTEPLVPYTRSTAHQAGWQWRIPLQHRTGNGHVYASAFSSKEQAQNTLLENIEGKLLAEPRLIKFATGKRKKVWNRNCIAIGLSAGFLEPLESTSLYLVQTAITRLITLFPDRDFNQANIDQYNRQSDFEVERIRDFIIAHYKVTQRNDSEFWRYCNSMSIPDSLQQKLEIYQAYGRIERQADELFREESWVQMLVGQNMLPNGYDPFVDVKTQQELESFVNTTQTVIKNCLAKLPSHADFISQHCLAQTMKNRK
jgi:tryptophan halogenase